MSKSKITDSSLVELVDCTYYFSDWGLISALSRSVHDHKLDAVRCLGPTCCMYVGKG